MTATLLSTAAARSWLLVNGGRPERFAAATASAADRVVLDLEDAVPESKKSAAREAVARWLGTATGVWVRINARSTAAWREDLVALNGAAGLAGVVLAKVETPQEAEDTVQGLGGTVPVIALLESAAGIEDSTAIARVRGVERLAFGSGDYRRDTGTGPDQIAMAYPRSRLVVASRVTGLPAPIDGPTVRESLEQLRDDGATAVVMGMTAKLCLRAEQAPAVNAVFSPDPTDVAWAEEVLSAFERTGGQLEDGSDLPRLRRAEHIRRLAQIYGISPS